MGALPRFTSPNSHTRHHSGHVRSPWLALPVMGALVVLAWLATTTTWPWLRASGALALLGLWFYLPYYLVRLWLHGSRPCPLQEAERLGVRTGYRPDARAWAAIYVVVLIAIAGLAIGIGRLLS